MSDLAFLDEPRRARVSDPHTSHLAAESVRELARYHARQILDCLQSHGPLGKDGIAARTGMDGVQVARRTTELERLGLIATTGRTVHSLSGRPEREWHIAPAASSIHPNH